MEFKKPDLNNNSGTGSKPADNANPDTAKKDKKPAKEKKPKIVYLEHRDTNFFERYEVVVEGKEANVDPLKLYMPLLAALAVVLIIYIIVKGISLGFSLSNKKLNAYINDSANVAAYNTAISYQKQTASVQKQQTSLDTIITNINTYPKFNKDFFTAVTSAAANTGVTVSSYSITGTSGTFAITCSSADVHAAANFKRALDSTGLFTYVDYAGYSGGDGGYSFSVTCYVKGNN